MNETFRKVLRFGLAGGTTTVAYFLFAYGLLMLLPARPLLTNVLAYLLCIGLSFLLQRNFTFRADGAFSAEFPRFVATSLFGLALSSVIVAVGTRHGVQPVTCFLLVALIVAPVSYLLLDRIVFRTPVNEVGDVRSNHHP